MVALKIVIKNNEGCKNIWCDFLVDFEFCDFRKFIEFFYGSYLNR